jgi:hypothetical protein
LLAKASVGLQVNDHIVEPGDVVFRHACLLGLEGPALCLWPLMALDQEQEPGGEAGGRRGLGQRHVATAVIRSGAGRSG